ncbi:hypothetical protein MAR_030356 [Mya arenaria]|uniref:Uncharacterized protein n=1 Tax=Mya arenaria TaxID=6604 RepID=A0ABY7DIZ6_MYAAR|nr:hypothetical protein MAR_030356 [Mya arenaria]
MRLLRNIQVTACISERNRERRNKRARMGMSNAERQRKFRARRDEDETRRRKYLQDSKEKYKKDKTLGKRKQVTDMTQRKKGTKERIGECRKEN